MDSDNNFQGQGVPSVLIDTGARATHLSTALAVKELLKVNIPPS